MEKNNWTFCYINFYRHKDDIGAYDVLLDLIKEDEYLIISEINGVKVLCFKSYGIDVEDLSPFKDKLKYHVLPFVFKHDAKNKKFADAVTGSRYSYHTYDNNPSERKFREDMGETGEYLEEVKAITISDATSIVKSMSKNDVQTYRRALRRVETLLLEAYTTYYSEIRKGNRARNRTQKN